jgi:hemerythrin superfamily protein
MPDRTDTDATHILAADHRKVEELFAKYENARGASDKQKLVKQICTELKIHAMVEEELFYPALTDKVDTDLLEEAYVEHDSAKVLIRELEASEPDEDFYDAKVKVLKEQIEHHVKEEERQQGNMFQQARAADVDLDSLGEQMLAFKAELVTAADAGKLDNPQPKTLTA